MGKKELELEVRTSLPADHNAFIRGEPAPALKAPMNKATKVTRTQSASPPSTRVPNGLVTRADGSKARRLVVYLPAELGTKLAMRCAQEGRKLTDAVTEAVGAWVDQQGA